MKYISNNSGGYSIIASIMMIGFLLVLTTSTLNLVLQEMKDGQGRQFYLKAYSAAESSLELALLEIKEHGYGYDDDSFVEKEMLGSGNLNPIMSYQFENKNSSVSGSLSPYETVFVPLFWIDAAGNTASISDMTLNSPSSEIIWNIIGVRDGISGKGNFLGTNLVSNKTATEVGGDVFLGASDISINTFLSTNSGSYLTLYNPSVGDILYDLSSSGDFSRPITEIISSGKVGKYSQNLKTKVDNTEFLGILKYSIYSGN